MVQPGARYNFRTKLNATCSSALKIQQEAGISNVACLVTDAEVARNKLGKSAGTVGRYLEEADSHLDIESLEAENDKSIDALGDRVGLLKKLTSNIKSEANSQHRVVDGLSDAMGGAQIGLAAASARFKRVFEDPRKNRTFLIVGVAVAVLFALYLLLMRK